ncbi:uncharacterized protein I303_102965 [Kwoniella dejecticola CBS 10117]|uniref:Integral membrane protein n=1 Tax=Kwoniella dejecticola CBS 10117 TaxID=1296121 RepID=A0A1A6AA79_9TREE|nr:uncharacterized protein I303_02984 [Kwoniella dejecticola CBS 10117]OBR86962.1 hypothetical protein I303_02984 [Kwoniella dejecticola CBS 10117]
MRVQGWDPVMIICQIITLQTIHYLTLSILIPPFLTSFTTPVLLSYAGGPNTVSHIMDWREMAAKPTISKTSFPGVEGLRKLRGAWAGGKEIGSVPSSNEDPARFEGDNQDERDSTYDEYWEYGVDRKRGWVLGGVWLVAFGIDIAPLYYLIRRPTYILDFSLTLIFNHFILTTYYSASFPTSIFFWLIQIVGAVVMVVISEHLCVKREMRSELDIGWQPNLESGQSQALLENQDTSVGPSGQSGSRPEAIQLQNR